MRGVLSRAESDVSQTLLDGSKILLAVDLDLHRPHLCCPAQWAAEDLAFRALDIDLQVVDRLEAATFHQRGQRDRGRLKRASAGSGNGKGIGRRHAIADRSI